MQVQTEKEHTSVRRWRAIQRRRSRKIRVGNVEIGGDAPLTVQSMTNTLTADAAATVDQIRQLEDAGADIVRVSCPDEDSTKAFKTIGKGAGMVYVAGKPDHRMDNEALVDHIVGLVEARAAALAASPPAPPLTRIPQVMEA